MVPVIPVNGDDTVDSPGAVAVISTDRARKGDCHESDAAPSRGPTVTMRGRRVFLTHLSRRADLSALPRADTSKEMLTAGPVDPSPGK